MRAIAAALLVGLGSARIVETLKEALPVVPPAPWKSTTATALAGAAGAVLVEGDWRTRALAGIGAAGVAMVTHELRSLLSLLADRQKVHVLRAANGR